MSVVDPGVPRGSIEVEAEQSLDAIEASLAAIERALAGFDDGSYGRCEVCGEAIDADRLAALASERRCALHASEGAG
jgi:RNA polymerase-binding transcription factor DksA